MKITKQARREAKELFRTCMVNGVLDEARARQAVTQVIAGKPRGYVAILSHFQRLVKLEVARRPAGSDVYDGSVQARLAALQESF